jgi:phosphoenolpyruvate---glycerone phosphotransferase subunit DhaL
VNSNIVHDLLDRVVETIVAHADELTALDRAIGDGDHGINMKRGFDAVRAGLPDLSSKPLAEVAKSVGMTLIMKVGGASGPLYGTLFAQVGKRLPAEPTKADFTVAFAGAIEAMQALGKSQPGQKTMLDVLVPVLRAIESRDDAALPDIGALAHAAAEATVPMKAIRGRASFLGDRSIGHMDPGARSCALIVDAIAGVLLDARGKGR